MKATTRKKIRRTTILLAGVGALGVGAYFGTRKSSEELVKILKQLVKDTGAMVHNTEYLARCAELNEKFIDYSREAIDHADISGLVDGKDYKFYPGLGIKFVNPENVDVIKKSAEKAAKVKKAA